ncbi:MAG TPA: SRPBCC family protein [Pseudonocardiaceae bacterium]|nr:SRPBCC family protein [Pseudonocardiaceae bacterium]
MSVLQNGNLKSFNLDGLVDTDTGVISREIFVNEKIFEMELENLFSRAWLFVGHESQIPNPGDYFMSRMGTDTVLMTRDNDGEVHVLLNSCRHRGMRVCRYDSGNTMTFTCPFHGWAYSVDGRLVSRAGELFGVPKLKAAYNGKLEREKWGLVEATSKNYKGMIFATWDSEAPPFEEYVGGFKHWIDNLTDGMTGRPGNTVAFDGVLKWRVPANWKLVVENFLGDGYHATPTHPSVEAVGIGPAGKGKTRHFFDAETEAFATKNLPMTSFVQLGHGATDTTHSDQFWGRPPAFADHPEFTEYFNNLWDEKRKLRLEAGLPMGGFGPATMFPSMSFHALGFPTTILVAHPVSATVTEIWRWFVVDKDMRPDAREWLRHYYLRYSGPAGMTEQDDMENWNYATRASEGAMARRLPYNYQIGLGQTQPSPLPGAVESEGFFTEEHMRNYYRRWQNLVEGKSWSELAATPAPAGHTGG